MNLTAVLLKEPKYNGQFIVWMLHKLSERMESKVTAEGKNPLESTLHQAHCFGIKDFSTNLKERHVPQCCPASGCSQTTAPMSPDR